jgi:drug/metabolite transporter (DMT)-like permease
MLGIYAALGVGVIGLGFSAIFVRWAEAPGIVSAGYRMAIGVTLMALPFWNSVRRRGSLPVNGVRWAMLGGLFFSLDIGFWATGVMMSGATNPTLVANVAPVWVGLGAMLLFHEKLNRRFWLGLLLSLCGAAVVLGLDSVQGFTLGLGTFLGLAASLFYALYYLATQRGRETLDPLSYSWISGTTSAVLLVLAIVLLGQPLTGYPIKSYLSFLAAGVLTQVLGYLAINYALGHVPASLVAPTLLGQPVATAILAGPLLGERLDAIQVIGGMGVLAGVFLVHTSKNRRKET